MTFQAKDGSLLYGVCQTLVNLTNTFDKPDIPDEMKQLGEFAKVKLPKFHEKVRPLMTCPLRMRLWLAAVVKREKDESRQAC